MPTADPRSEPGRPTVVAIVDTSPDTIGLLAEGIERAGFVVVSALTHEIRNGHLDLRAFVEQHRPKVFVYDIAPPYERNYRLLQHVRAVADHGIRFVLTSTNAAHVQQLVGRDDRVYEVIDRSLNIDLIVSAVKEAAKARETR
jgi:DNA-binding NtrC family response regulator